jgi:hypothetical protein
LVHTCRAHGATFPTTLTTTALDRSSSGWFPASPCRAAAEVHQPDGPAPPSLMQHRINQSDLLHRSSLLRSWHTRDCRFEVPLPCHQVPRPDRTRQSSLGNEMEARAEGVRHSFRRKNPLTHQARSTVHRTDPTVRGRASPRHLSLGGRPNWSVPAAESELERPRDTGTHPCGELANGSRNTGCMT